MNRYGFYVSGNATRLKNYIKYLEKSRDEGTLKQIIVIISDNPQDTDLNEILSPFNICVVYFDSSTLPKEYINVKLSDFILSYFDKMGIDYGFVFGRRILKGELLNRYKDRLINFHPSILPAFKGINSIDKALTERAFLLGNSAHFLVEDVDSGPIIMQNIVHSSLFKTYDDLLNNQIPMLNQILHWLNQSRIEIVDGYVQVKNADYSISGFIPNLEEFRTQSI